ncbi:MAG: (2Fe-2S)-binding protein [bacterium]|nr:(2Fe-2S)-binding protein [bacterium]
MKANLVVTHCVCAGISFADLLRLARERGWDLQELARETRVTRNCGLCLPYVVRMLRTGETAFEVMADPDGGEQGRCGAGD